MLYLTIIGGAFIAWLIVVTLFTPAVPYHVETPLDPESEQFVRVLESACQARLKPGTRIVQVAKLPS